MNYNQNGNGGEKIRKIISVLLFLVIIAGCVQKPPDIQAGDIVAVSSPIMRGVVSVFMKISNNGGRDDLVSAKTDIQGTIVELHDVKDGKMVKVKNIKIPFNGRVEMVPGGLHIMIFKLPDEIKEGSEFTLYLGFEKSGEKAVKLKITKSV